MAFMNITSVWIWIKFLSLPFYMCRGMPHCMTKPHRHVHDRRIQEGTIVVSCAHRRNKIPNNIYWKTKCAHANVDDLHILNQNWNSLISQFEEILRFKSCPCIHTNLTFNCVKTIFVAIILVFCLSRSQY